VRSPYFSGKVRPALRAKRVPYDEILPTTAAYREVLVPRTGLAMIPVVVTPEDETWQDSSDILDALEARFPESETRGRQDFAIMTGDERRAGRFADQVKAFTGLTGVRPETAPAIEAHTRELLGALEAHFETEPYLLGGRPSLADCALMGPLYAQPLHGRGAVAPAARDGDPEVPVDRAHEPSRCYGSRRKLGDRPS
jgi:glutathione S-transferase